MSENVERAMRQSRSFSLKFNAREDGKKKYIEGYFARFDDVYEMWEGAKERIAAGTFAQALQNDDVRALINHDSSLVLGRNKAGTLQLHEDETGLWGCIEVNENDVDAMNLYARVQRGDVDQCSFGFDILDEDVEDIPAGGLLWTLKRVKLYEVSVVTFPAYENTSVSARRRDFENIQKRKHEAWKTSMLQKLKGAL